MSIYNKLVHKVTCNLWICSLCEWVLQRTRSNRSKPRQINWGSNIWRLQVCFGLQIFWWNHGRYFISLFEIIGFISFIICIFIILVIWAGITCKLGTEALKALLQISMAAVCQIGKCSSPFRIHCCSSTRMSTNWNSGEYTNQSIKDFFFFQRSILRS